MFCLKACDPADENDWHYCEHIFDRIGCYYKSVLENPSGRRSIMDSPLFTSLLISDSCRLLSFFCPNSAPASYGTINGTFTSCESENQMFPGVYVNEAGRTVT